MLDQACFVSVFLFFLTTNFFHILVVTRYLIFYFKENKVSVTHAQTSLVTRDYIPTKINYFEYSDAGYVTFLETDYDICMKVSQKLKIKYFSCNLIMISRLWLLLPPKLYVSISWFWGIFFWKNASFLHKVF